MRSQVLLLCAMLAGCSGVQGGSEGEEGGRCEYDTVALTDPNAAPAGFEQAPSQLFSVILRPLVGRLANGRAVALQFEPDYADLRGLYVSNGATDCGPHLATSARATLVVEGAGAAQSSINAGLEIRWGNPLASARFEAAPGTPLASVVPDFGREPVSNPMLDLWLLEFGSKGVDSKWQWSAFVGCKASEQCSGGTSPTGGATSGAEVSWGETQLVAE